MALPVLITDSNGNTLNQTPTRLKALRQAVIAKLFNGFIGSDLRGNRIAEQLAQITQVLSRTATNEPTAYENGLVKTSATGAANLLTRQVERAISQVLGRSPGKGSEGFMKALYGTFPTTKNGKVMFTPARSVVSLYSPYGEGNQVISGSNGMGLTGQLPIEQANLYRQASIIAYDALKVLESIAPFDPTADIDAVEALKALIRSQLNSLVEEFGRLDEPRPDRVNLYFRTLDTNLDEIGIRGRLSNENNVGGYAPVDLEEVFPVTLDDEAQVAALELLKNYVDTLEDIWTRFLNISGSEQVSGHYSERLARVSILLPVVADSNVSFMAALDSIGFTESERRSDAALFTSLDNLGETLFALSINDPLNTDPDNPIVDPDNPGSPQFPITITVDPVSLPKITLNDFNDWLDRFTTLEAPTVLADSGRFGLEFVTDQADTLFWVIAIVLDFIQQSNQLNNPIFRAGESLLERILSFDRVRQTLLELAFQLDTLADFGVEAGTNDLINLSSGDIRRNSGSAIVRQPN
jgi:hypothetical protein